MGSEGEKAQDGMSACITGENGDTYSTTGELTGEITVDEEDKKVDSGDSTATLNMANVELKTTTFPSDEVGTYTYTLLIDTNKDGNYEPIEGYSITDGGEMALPVGTSYKIVANENGEYITNSKDLSYNHTNKEITGIVAEDGSTASFIRIKNQYKQFRKNWNDNQGKNKPEIELKLHVSYDGLL